MYVGSGRRADRDPPDRHGPGRGPRVEQRPVQQPAGRPVGLQRGGPDAEHPRDGADRGALRRRRCHVVRRRDGRARGLTGDRQQPTVTVEDGHQLAAEHRQPGPGLLEPHHVAPGHPGDRGRAQVAAADAEGPADPVELGPGGRDGGRADRETRDPGTVGGEQPDPAGRVPQHPDARGRRHRWRGRSRGAVGRGSADRQRRPAARHRHRRAGRAGRPVRPGQREAGCGDGAGAARGSPGASG